MKKHVLLEPRIAIWNLMQGLESKSGYRSFLITAGLTEIVLGVYANLGTNRPFVWFSHKINNKEVATYKISLTTTPCHFGNQRYWFECPLMRNGLRCHGRSGTLYKIGDLFGCRHCCDLTYPIKQLPRKQFHNLTTQQVLHDLRIERALKRMKRPFYAGKPTHMYAKLIELTGE